LKERSKIKAVWEKYILEGKVRIGLDVRGSVHHSTIHKETSNKMQQYIKILLFCRVCAWQSPPTTRPTTFHL